VPDVRPDVARAAVRQRGDLTFVDTPAGRFLLTAGDEVDQDALDRLSDTDRPTVRVGVAAPPTVAQVR